MADFIMYVELTATPVELLVSLRELVTTKGLLAVDVVTTVDVFAAAVEVVIV